MHVSKGLVFRLAVASCHTPKLRALGKGVESRTCPVSSRATLARDYRQMHSVRVYSRQYKIFERPFLLVRESIVNNTYLAERPIHQS